MPIPRLHQCNFRGDPLSAAEFHCNYFGSPTTPDFCESCPAFVRRSESRDGHIGWVISTADRNPPTYPQALASINHAGFTAYGCTFGDFSPPLFGPFGALMQSLSMLYYRQPHLSAYCYFQDDVLLHRTAKAELTRFLVDHGAPDEPLVASLYAPDDLPGRILVSGESREWRRCDNGWQTPGAVTLIFTPPALRELLCEPFFVQHRFRGPHEGWRQIDQVVGWLASRYGGIWYPPTQLAKHIGAVSSTFKHGVPRP